jgi:hypothetical protein
MPDQEPWTLGDRKGLRLSAMADEKELHHLPYEDLCRYLETVVRPALEKRILDFRGAESSSAKIRLPDGLIDTSTSLQEINQQSAPVRCEEAPPPQKQSDPRGRRASLHRAPLPQRPRFGF